MRRAPQRRTGSYLPYVASGRGVVSTILIGYSSSWVVYRWGPIHVGASAKYSPYPCSTHTYHGYCGYYVIMAIMATMAILSTIAIYGYYGSGSCYDGEGSTFRLQCFLNLTGLRNPKSSKCLRPILFSSWFSLYTSPGPCDVSFGAIAVLRFSPNLDFWG